MKNTLRSKNLEIYVDFPDEGYNNSRFDWTGKITGVNYNDKALSGNEIRNQKDNDIFGKGFYNEFGIDSPLGYNETEIGAWFHKIGIGLLKKEESDYEFNKEYKIKPANFKVEQGINKIRIICKSELINGYSYLLEKEIEIQDSGFEIRYYLENTGIKSIVTDEYNHNFISLNKREIGKDYILKFPFTIKPELFKETVNPGGLVQINKNEIKFRGTPREQFYFSNLSGNQRVKAKWEIENKRSGIGISEQGDFASKTINLWGREEVMSPELFIELDIKSGQSKRWSRTYKVYKTN